VGTAVLVALPALVSAATPRPPPAQPPAARPLRRRRRQGRRSGARLRSRLVRPVGGRENPPKYEQKRVKLSDFKGKQNVVVAFFPAAFSPGCTNEMKQYQTNHGTFTPPTPRSRRQRRQHLVEPRLPRAARRRVPDPERLEARRGARPTACYDENAASPAAPRSSSTRRRRAARSTSAATRSIRPASSGCARRSKPIELGSPQLEIIRAIAEAGSFTGAGERLHVSQSAISRQILLLEEELNEAVFLRVGRRIRITPAVRRCSSSVTASSRI
jgi:hypothetical protein